MTKISHYCRNLYNLYNKAILLSSIIRNSDSINEFMFVLTINDSHVKTEAFIYAVNNKRNAL